MPERLNNIYQARLSQLNKSLISIIELAAVIGFQFDKNIIFQLVNKKEQEIIPAVDHIIFSGVFIDIAKQDKFQFSHHKLREYVYNSISSLKRNFYHKEIYYCFLDIQNNGKEQNKLVTNLAWHAYKAGIWEKAIKYNLLAGKYSLEEGLVFQSIHYLTRALEIYGKCKIHTPKMLISIYLNRGKTYFFMGEKDKANIDLKKALDLSNTNNDIQSEGKLYSLLARVNTRMGNFDSALNYIQKVIEMDNILIDIQILIESLSTMSWVSSMTNNLNLGQIISEKLNEIIERIPFKKNNHALGRALFIQGQHYFFLFEQIEQAVSCFNNSELIFRNLQEEEDLALILAYTGFCYFCHNIEKTWSLKFEESLKLTRKKAVNIHLICSILGPIITTYLIRGEYGKALQLMEEYPIQGTYPSWIIPLLAVKGEIYFWLGNKNKATKLIQQCLDYCQDINYIDYKNHAISTLGLIKGNYESFDKGLKLLENAEKEAMEIPLKIRLCRVLQKKMFLVLNCGNIGLLQTEANKLLQLGKTAKIPFAIGWALYGQGIAELIKGNFKNAQRNLVKSLKLAHQTGVSSLIWRAESALADIALINLDIITAEKHYHKAGKILENIVDELPEVKLQESFLQRTEIRRIIIRGHRKLAKGYFNDKKRAEINAIPDLLNNSTSKFDQRLVAVVGKYLGKVRKRQLQIAGTLLETNNLQISLKSANLAEHFGVHPRTIRRDLKKIHSQN